MLCVKSKSYPEQVSAIRHPARHYIHYLISKRIFNAKAIVEQLQELTLPVPMYDGDDFDFFAKEILQVRAVMAYPSNFDPRAKVMKQTCDEVLGELGINDPQLELAMKLEEIALQDPYFVERNLYPNVDFYSGIILKAIGIPTEMFTVIFAVGRTPGWFAHWNEMISEPYKIGRPRQLYTGYAQRDYPNK